MKSLRQIIQHLLFWSLIAGIISSALLMAHDLYFSFSSDVYTVRKDNIALPVVTGMPPDSLLNSGDIKALDVLPGIGEVLAGRIIETRERDGLYFFPEDIMTVNGIGEKRFSDIMNWLAAQEATPSDLTISP